MRARVSSRAYRRSLATWTESLRSEMRTPRLRMVAWIATRRCNLTCRYCAIPSEQATGEELSTDEALRIFDDIATSFDPAEITVGITGGEATLRGDLVTLVTALVKRGFKQVAVDSNGVQYGRDPSLFDRLVDAGMRGPTISVDGWNECPGGSEGQRAMRGDPTGGALTWKAIEYAQTRYPQLGTTTICGVSRYNVDEFAAVFDRFEQLGIAFTRVSPIFAGGRAVANADLSLSAPQLRDVMKWIAARRARFVAGQSPLEVELIDDGWCGLEWEGGLLRGGFYSCQAGLGLLGLEHDGRIVGCPVIGEGFNVQGDARRESVGRVWRERFQAFRDRSWLRQGPCETCTEWAFCQGGSLHHRSATGALLDCTARSLRGQETPRRRLPVVG